MILGMLVLMKIPDSDWAPKWPSWTVRSASAVLFELSGDLVLVSRGMSSMVEGMQPKTNVSLSSVCLLFVSGDLCSRSKGGDRIVSWAIQNWITAPGSATEGSASAAVSPKDSPIMEVKSYRADSAMWKDVWGSRDRSPAFGPQPPPPLTCSC